MKHPITGLYRWFTPDDPFTALTYAQGTFVVVAVLCLALGIMQSLSLPVPAIHYAAALGCSCAALLCDSKRYFNHSHAMATEPGQDRS